ncbi:methylenetetrahydrofolate reductase [Jiulongibacter sp. NS-SX5]|uniref:methylenetetrahydrofolate reductase n=1 Tax=Jiulongibacter sp. NS-SX5 TaxID=3463854 RepID=UPI004057DFC8
MFIDKIKEGKSGLLLYGITPPKMETPKEKVTLIAERTFNRVKDLPLDALVVYDVQDESARTDKERPFPFIGALDPFRFASEYLSALQIPKIIYRPAGKFSQDELSSWLTDLKAHQYYPIFVGVPSPTFTPKTSLPQAYKLWEAQKENSVLGAITIPERHAVLNDEQNRMLSKMESGVSYFISQCVFNVDYAKKMLKDLADTCQSTNCKLPTVIFTLTTCGSEKTLSFMEWLGIHVPQNMKDELLAAENMLEKSISLCLSIAQELTEFCLESKIPFGFNIESVAIRKTEIEASIAITNEVAKLLKEKGLR